MSRERSYLLALFAVILLVTGSGTVGYRLLSSSTDVSTEEAVQRFRKGRSPSPTARPHGGDHAQNAEPSSSGAGEQTVEDPETPSLAIDSEPFGPEPSGTPETDDEVTADRPEPGVYSWRTEGFERAAGVRRELPKETQRIVELGDDSWTAHHVFSQEKEQWFTFMTTNRGVEVSQVRDKIRIGPFVEDETIEFDPPQQFVPIPIRQGDRWEGPWASSDGDLYGTLQGVVGHRETVPIGNQSFETWMVDVVLQIEGDAAGRIEYRAWFSTELGMAVREQVVEDIEDGPVSYHAEWDIKLLSAEAQR